LSACPVQRLEDHSNLTVHETYTCDAKGNVQVKISADPSGYTRNFLIAQSAHDGSATNGSASKRSLSAKA